MVTASSVRCYGTVGEIGGRNPWREFNRGIKTGGIINLLGFGSQSIVEDSPQKKRAGEVEGGGERKHKYSKIYNIQWRSMRRRIMMINKGNGYRLHIDLNIYFFILCCSLIIGSIIEKSLSPTILL
jgi:hypothetical protein